MRFIAIISLLLTFLSVNAQNAESLIDTNRILLGGQVKLSLMLTCKAQDTVVWPQIGDTLLTEVEVLSASSIDTAYDSQDISTKLYTQDLVITSFDSGYYAVPPFEYSVNGKLVKSNAFLLYVGNVPLENEDSIRDIKDIVEVEYGLLDWLKDYWQLIASVLAFIVLAYLFIKRYLKQRAEKPLVVKAKPKIPAHIIALKKLKDLEHKKLWQNEKTKAYHSELTEIIREYLEHRYEIHALEQTSDEIMKSLRYSEIKDVNRKKLRQLLLLADLVKFAKEKPLPAENEESLKYAYEFVETTKEQVQQKEEKEENNA